MVSNWFSAISRSRCGNSSVITPSGVEQPRHAGDEVVEVGHLGEHVVADDQVGALALGDAARSASATPKNSTRRRNALVERDLGDVGGRLDAEHGHAERQEMLQQIAVVARQLDHQAVRPEPEPLRDHLAVGLGVRDPAGRVGGEVGVLAEDVLRAHVLLELHQEAARRRPAHAAGSRAPSRRAARGARKLSHSGDMPRSTKLCASAPPHRRQRRTVSMPAAGSASSTCALMRAPAGAARAPQSSPSSPLPMDSKIAGMTSSAGDHRRRYQDRGCGRA